MTITRLGKFRLNHDLSGQIIRSRRQVTHRLCVVRRFDHQNSHRRFLLYFCVKHYVRHMQQGLHVLFSDVATRPVDFPTFFARSSTVSVLDLSLSSAIALL